MMLNHDLYQVVFFLFLQLPFLLSVLSYFIFSGLIDKNHFDFASAEMPRNAVWKCFCFPIGMSLPSSIFLMLSFSLLLCCGIFWSFLWLPVVFIPKESQLFACYLSPKIVWPCPCFVDPVAHLPTAEVKESDDADWCYQSVAHASKKYGRQRIHVRAETSAYKATFPRSGLLFQPNVSKYWFSCIYLVSLGRCYLPHCQCPDPSGKSRYV